MRKAQIAVFVLGLVAFLIAGFFAGQEMGDTLWRIGVAVMLAELVWLKLWPPLGKARG